MPSAFSIVNHNFTGQRERSKAIGIFSAFAAIGSGSGLSIGGLIASYWGWQWVFFINVPILLVVLVLALIILEADRPETTKLPDLLSGMLLVGGLVLLTFAIHMLPQLKQHWVLFLIFIAAILASFKFLQIRLKQQEDPLISKELFRIPAVIKGNVSFILLGAFFTGYLFVVSLILQHNFNFSAAKAGFMLVPFSILSALIARFVQNAIIKSLGVERTAVIGMFSMLAGGILLLLSVWLTDIFLLLCAAACIAGVGITLCFTTFSVISMQHVPQKDYGLASSLTTTSYFLGGGTGLSILSLFMNSDGADHEITIVPLIIMCVYAIVCLVWLMRYKEKNIKTLNHEQVISPVS